MAFRILTSDEIELLTEQQRVSYEEELAIYNERVRFVEQLEKQENAVIQPYKPVLKPISAIKKAPERTYSAPEYTVAPNAVPIATVPETVSVSEQRVTAVVPKQVRVESVSVAYVKAPEKEAVELPTIHKVATPQVTMDKIERPAPVLARQKEIVAPVLQTDNLPMVECRIPEKVTADVPEVGAVSAVSIDTNAIRAATNTVTVPQPDRYAFTAPEPVCVKVPQTTVPTCEIKNIKVLTEAKADLPELLPTKQPVGSFIAPELETVSIPSASKPAVPVKTIAKSQPGKPQLPVVSGVVVPAKTFEQAEPVQADLTVPAASVVPANSYLAPECAQPELPPLTAAVKLPKVTSIPQQPQKVQIKQQSAVKLPKTDFQVVSCTVAPHPEIKTVCVPDVSADEIVRSLLSSNE